MSKLLRIEQPKTEIQTMMARARDRLKRQSRSKQRKIIRVEHLWEQFAQTRDVDPLLRHEYVFQLIQSRAKGYASKWRKCGLSAHEFEEAFWMETWRIVEDKYTWCSEFFLYETLEQAIKHRAQDVIRQGTRTQEAQFYASMKVLKEYDAVSSSNVENEVLVLLMMTDDTFNERERRLLAVMYADPVASLTTLADLLGQSHHEPVRRMLATIRKKITA